MPVCSSTARYITLGSGVGLTKAAQLGRRAVVSEAEALAARQLARQLTSEEQLAQALAGKGEALMGAGTTKKLDQAARLAREHGGSPSDWAKMRTSSSAVHGVKTEAGSNFEIHWYENVKTGARVEIKTKLQ
jgi:hypothetical protein